RGGITSMRRWVPALLLSLGSMPIVSESTLSRPQRGELYRSPVDVAVLPDGRRALAANQGADSVSLVDLSEGKGLAEQSWGHKPAGLACSRDGMRAAVANLWSATVTLLTIEDATLRVEGEVQVGSLPRGLVFAANGANVYAAVAGSDEVVRIDWSNRKVTQRWPAPREPRQLALSADGRSLAAGSSRSGQVRCWDSQSGRLSWERKIEDGYNLRGVAFTPDGRGLVVAHNIHREFPVSKENIEQGWVLDSRLTQFPLQPDAVQPQA